MRFRFLTFTLLLAVLAVPGLTIAAAQEPPADGIDLRQEPDLLWTFSAIGESSIHAIVDGTIYFSDDADNLYAVDAITGQQRWVQPAAYFHRFEVVDGIIYASNSGLKQVYVFDATTGAPLVTVPVSGEGFRFSVVGDLLYIEDTQVGELSVFNVAAGGFALRYFGGWWLRGDMLYYSSDGILRGIDARTSELLWTIPLDPDSNYEPVGDILIIRNGNTGHLTIIDSATGETRWSTTVGGRVLPKSVSEETIYVRGEDAALFAFDLATGEQRWVVPTFIEERNDYSARFVDGTIYIHADNLIVVDDQSGVMRWATPIGANYNNTRIKDGVVFAIHRDESEGIATPTIDEAPRTLHALEAETGGTLWSFPLGPGFSHIEHVGDELIYVRDDADTLVAIDTTTGEEAWSVPMVYRINTSAFENGIVASGDSLAAIDTITGEAVWSFAADSRITSYPYLGEETIHFQSDDGAIYALGNEEEAAAHIAEAEAAESLAAAWDAYLGTNLPDAFTANIAEIPGMSVVSFDIGINVDTFSIPEGYERIIAFPVRVMGGATATWTTLTIFPSAEDADTAMANMSGGLIRSGWTVQNVDGLDHNHACLSLSTSDSSEALCYMTRDDTLIISHSTVPVPTPDAALLNAVDLTRALNDAYNEAERPK